MNILECRKIGERYFEFSCTIDRGGGDYIKFSEGKFTTQKKCLAAIAKSAMGKILAGEEFKFIGCT